MTVKTVTRYFACRLVVIQANYDHSKHKWVIISRLIKTALLLLLLELLSPVAEIKCKIKLLKRFVEAPHYWLYATLKDMVLIVGKLPIKKHTSGSS